jgi:hypothetical protein
LKIVQEEVREFSVSEATAPAPVLSSFAAASGLRRWRRPRRADLEGNKVEKLVLEALEEEEEEEEAAAGGMKLVRVLVPLSIQAASS